MSDDEKMPVGSIAWRDLTVAEAGVLKDFYQTVVGWTVQSTDMGGYDDFTMVAPADGDAVCGVCHARGTNADLPPQWLMYVVVEDLDQSISRCTELGGDVVAGPRPLAGGTFCVIRDPVGAVCALWQQGV